MRFARYIATIWCCLLAIGLGGIVRAGGEATSRPARRWGPVKAGLALSVELTGAVDQGGKCVLAPALRNTGREVGRLCPQADAVAWLILKFLPSGGTAGKYYFSSRVLPGSAKGSPIWPRSLASGGRLDLARMDFGGVRLHPYSKGVKFLSHHVTGKGSIPEAVGKLRDVLGVGKANLQYMLYLPRKDDSPVLLKSDFLSIEIGPPDLTKLSLSARKAFVDKLIAGFGGDAFGGHAAHRVAVRLGAEIVDDLIGAMKTRAAKGAGRMWLATALADIRDKRCAAVLIKLIDEPGGVGHVVAYHGPKQRNAELDAVIIARGSKTTDARMTALAMLGFMVFRGQAPRKLLDAGINSNDPRVRSTVVAALSRSASLENVNGLVLLLKDTEARVRSAAARGLGAMGNRDASVVGGLIAALGIEGDGARSDVCDALGKLTGRQSPYDKNAPSDKKRKIVAGWVKWWTAARKNHR